MIFSNESKRKTAQMWEDIKISHIFSNFEKEPKIVELKGDASSRQYFRLLVDDKSFILVTYPRSSHAEEIENNAFGRSAAEDFIETQVILSNAKVRVPRILDFLQDAHIMILEDFGDTLLLHASKADPQKETVLYTNATDELIKMISSGLSLNDSSFIAKRHFDEDTLTQEFYHFTECCLDQGIETPPSAEYGQLKTLFEGLAAQISSWPTALCHRDFHSRNIMVLKDSSQLGIIDFQDALMGPIVYDLASLLRDAYISVSIETQRCCLEKLYNFSKEHLQIGGLSFDGFEYYFRVVGMQRNLKAAGRFFYFYQRDGNKAYLPDVPRALSYVKKDFEELDSCKHLKDFFLDQADRIDEKVAQLCKA